MSKKATSKAGPQDSALNELIGTIVARDGQEAARLLAASPELARQAVTAGATRADSTDHFYPEICHYVYAGDTALHVAAAAYQREIATALIAKGANPGARNRRGGEPLHYAADGSPGSPSWNPDAQAAVVEVLIKAGADANSPDKSGVTPLHRAVRTRCAAAVRALLGNGADLLRRNGSGSTPLHLAVQNTGRGGAGSAAAKEQQKEVIVLLLQHGARPADKDSRGKSVQQCVTSEWILELFEAGSFVQA